VTALFADLTGFTALSQSLDPEAVYELLNRYFAVADSVIQFYGGRIDKHIGDGIMAVFGAPVAHSNDPERAIRAAIEIHAALANLNPPLTVHIGIACGTVVASLELEDFSLNRLLRTKRDEIDARLDEFAEMTSF
jgi:class 3 adenylate cyclase